jgi:hypothetical protein
MTSVIERIGEAYDSFMKSQTLRQDIEDSNEIPFDARRQLLVGVRRVARKNIALLERLIPTARRALMRMNLYNRSNPGGAMLLDAIELVTLVQKTPRFYDDPSWPE